MQSAQGQSVQYVKEAEAYKAEKVANAQGDAQRFLSVYAQYKLNPEVTERRLYLESMQTIFGGMNKVLIDPSAAGSGAVPSSAARPADQEGAEQFTDDPAAAAAAGFGHHCHTCGTVGRHAMNRRAGSQRSWWLSPRSCSTSPPSPWI